VRGRRAKENTVMNLPSSSALALPVEPTWSDVACAIVRILGRLLDGPDAPTWITLVLFGAAAGYALGWLHARRSRQAGYTARRVLGRRPAAGANEYGELP
jgi:hypothetical protein